MKKMVEAQVHAIQQLTRNNGYDILMDYLVAELEMAKNQLIDSNEESIRGQAYCLRQLIQVLREAESFEAESY